MCQGIFSLACLLLGLFGYVALTRMGLGTSFPTAPYDSLLPLLDSSSLHIVASLETPPGNVAVSRSGRVFFTFHPEYNPTVKIAELIAEASIGSSDSWQAYPSRSFQDEITTVLSLRVDNSNERLWLLDFGLHGIASSPKLVSISLQTNEKDTTYFFPSEIAGVGSMLNDFSINEDGSFLYIADTSILAQSPAIIVYSVKRNTSHRLLSSHSSLFGRSSFFNVSHHPIGFGPFGMKINVDSIALSRDNRALYFAPLSGSELLCVDVVHLHAAMCSRDQADCLLRQSLLAESVKVVLQDKPITDGITTDEDGNLWLTALGLSSIGVAAPSQPSAGEECTASPGSDSNEQCEEIHEVCRPLVLTNVVQSEEMLRWADGFSFGPDGLYITNSALFMKFNQLPLPSAAPYHILKVAAKDLLDVKRFFSASTSASSRTHVPAQTDVDMESYLNILKKLSGQ